MNNEQWSLIDVISVLSFIIGLKNLELNKVQVDGLMREMQDNQNSMLQTIIKQNDEIIHLLKEKQDDRSI